MSGGKCVLQAIGGTDIGTYCFYPATSCASASNPSNNPFSRSVSGSSVDGFDGTYCLPPTTCSAYFDAINVTPCTNNNQCGIVDRPDGICAESGDAADQCTYTCVTDYDCPDRLAVCDAIGSFCRPM